MSKNLLILVSLLLFVSSCSEYIPQNELFNNHLTTQLGYEFHNKKGVYKIIEKNTTDEVSLARELINYLPVKIDPQTEYTHAYNEEGDIIQTYINNNQDYSIRFEYNRTKQLLSIAGYHPGYVKEIFEYRPDNFLKFIFRETDQNVMFKYSDDMKTISGFQFKPIKDGNKRALKPEKLLYQMLLKNYEDGSFVVEVNDADKGILTQKYTYLGYNLIKKELLNEANVSYNFNDKNDISEIEVKRNNGDVIKYLIEYQYDDNKNWISRIVNKDNTQILNTERNISYYN